jgi:antitoxin (DNA-binding transcriptional repressor) of toxin-antitoxin stability system
MNVTVTEMARHFSDYLNRVSYAGERFLLVRGKKVLAELHPAPQGRRLGDLPALLKALPPLGPEDARGLARDVEAARKRLNRRPARDPWAS